VADFDLSIFDNEKTLDFIASVNSDCTPHITVFNSVLKYNETTLMFGEYCRGISKVNLVKNKKAAIFALGPDGRYSMGTLTWKGKVNTGPEHELFNNIPRLRYNATYGFEWIHMLQVNDFTDGIRSDAVTYAEDEAFRAIVATVPAGTVPAMNFAARQLFDDTESVKMLSYIREDGFPQIVLLRQGKLSGTSTAVLEKAPVGGDIPDDVQVTVISYVNRFGSSITVKGTVHRKTISDKEIYILDIERVYNGNNPKAGYIYPVEPIEPVRIFENAADV
jgi:hypothetical protein